MPCEGTRCARPRVLMILTHDRLDCLRLCLDMLERAEAFARFDRVVLLLNGVPPRLRRFVERYMAARPQVAWDTVEGDGTRPGGFAMFRTSAFAATRIRCMSRWTRMSSSPRAGRNVCWKPMTSIRRAATWH